MIPATRKPTATITVTQAEATIGKLRASTPSTIIITPSAWVNPFSRPASRARRSRAVEVSKGSLFGGKEAPEVMAKSEINAER